MSSETLNEEILVQISANAAAMPDTSVIAVKTALPLSLPLILLTVMISGTRKTRSAIPIISGAVTAEGKLPWETNASPAGWDKSDPLGAKDPTRTGTMSQTATLRATAMTMPTSSALMLSDLDFIAVSVDMGFLSSAAQTVESAPGEHLRHARLIIWHRWQM